MKYMKLIAGILIVCGLTYTSIKFDQNKATNNLNTELSQLVQSNKIEDYTIKTKANLYRTIYTVTVKHTKENKTRYPELVQITRPCFAGTQFDVQFE